MQKLIQKMGLNLSRNNLGLKKCRVFFIKTPSILFELKIDLVYQAKFYTYFTQIIKSRIDLEKKN